MWQGFRRLRMAPVLALAAVMMVTACGSTGSRTSDANLTPAQRNLRTEAERFNSTVGEAAVIGAIAGGIIGALVVDDNRAAGAAIGAGLGAAIGGGAGYLVASQNQQYATREAQLDAQISAAEQDVARYREIVRTTQTVVNQHKARIAELNQQLASGQVNLGQVQTEQATMRQDLDLINDLIRENETIVNSYDAEISEARQQGTSTAQLQTARNALVDERRALQAQYDELLQAVSDLPTS